MIVVADTSPLTALLHLKQLPLLEALYGQVIIPFTVSEELQTLIPFGYDISFLQDAERFNVRKATDILFIRSLSEHLDSEEAEAIELAKEFNELFRQRTKKLALDVIAVVAKMKYDDAAMILKKQLIKSATSVAANFRAVCRARSEKEHFAKLSIVVEEADESLFWIEMIEESGFLSAEKVSDIKREVEEILKVMSAFRKNLSIAAG